MRRRSEIVRRISSRCAQWYTASARSDPTCWAHAVLAAVRALFVAAATVVANVLGGCGGALPPVYSYVPRAEHVDLQDVCRPRDGEGYCGDDCRPAPSARRRGRKRTTGTAISRWQSSPSTISHRLRVSATNRRRIDATREKAPRRPHAAMTRSDYLTNDAYSKVPINALSD